jgi:hypothetical protein
MILATVNTGSMDWIALAHHGAAAQAALVAAYARHCATDTLADPALMAELVTGGDVNLYAIEPGMVLRDGSVI